MKILQPGKPVPSSFVTTCDKGFGSGCGAVLEVFPEDCFRCPYVNDRGWLSFYCAHCGLILTPDYERIDHDRIKNLPPEDQANFAVKTKDNCPPWSTANFPEFNEFNEKNNIKSWSYR